MTVDPVHVIGAGGHAKVLLSTLLAAGQTIAGLYDDREDVWGTTVLGHPVRGAVASVSSNALAVLGIGSNRVRATLSTLPVRWATVIHPRAIVHESVTIAEGSVVFAGVVVQPDTRIGRHAILNTGATVDHDCVVESFTHIAPGVHLCGGVHVGEGALLGVGSSAIPGVRIGAWSVVGAGACCVRAVPDGSVAMGVPARVVRTA